MRTQQATTTVFVATVQDDDGCHEGNAPRVFATLQGAKDALVEAVSAELEDECVVEWEDEETTWTALVEDVWTLQVVAVQVED
jgi:hypothetical protein